MAKVKKKHGGQTHITVPDETWPKIFKLAEWWSPHEALRVSSVINIALKRVYEQELKERGNDLGQKPSAD